MKSKHLTPILCIGLFAVTADASEPERGLSMAREVPWEWSFTDGRSGPFTDIERSLAKIMQGPRHGERIQAAALLWRNHSLYYAPEVLKLAAETEMTEESRNRELLRKEIDASFAPQSLLHELKEGDYLWALRLACLRPQPELTEDLLNEFGTRPHQGDDWTALMLAVGKTRDRRALASLLDLLKQEDPSIAGFAAEALGDLGYAEAEPDLIEALGQKSPFVQAKAAWVLGRIGTPAALPALKKIANNKEKIGVIDTKRAAIEAIKELSKRTGS